VPIDHFVAEERNVALRESTESDDLTEGRDIIASRIGCMKWMTG
jgi:hypothetical protein